MSLIRDAVLVFVFAEMDLVNTFFGKLRYGPVSTSLPYYT